ncbi:MAG: Hsp20/alpha crystallin family protein [Aquabacterium sp.]|jgi:HSP20 family protein|nr:MAG: Hsp20/alpha crystallin family protein [Aquabacterium sp.]TAL21287.1 MAG: Hsp20/alpha crystallin family protein [Aquabacterium sp.]
MTAEVTRMKEQAPQAAAGAAARQEQALLPPVDVIEDGSGITLYADLPGVPKEGLQLRVEGDQLWIEGEAVLALPQGMEPTHAEVGLSHYRRSFTLSKELDAEKIGAEFSHGVLRVRIPKAEHAQPRRIAVQVS